MFAAFFRDIEGSGLGYACTLLQLHLGVGFSIGCITWAVGENAQLRKQLAGVPWKAALRAWAAVARPVLLLAVFALVQVRAEAIGVLTVVGLFYAALPVVAGTFLTILMPLCGGPVPDVVAEIGHISWKTLENGWLARFCILLDIVKFCGHIVLLAVTLPGGAQLIIASAMARLAIAIELLHIIASNMGFADSALAEVCRDAARVLHIAPLLGGLAIMDHMAWGPLSALVMPFHPLFYCALGLAAQVGLVLVLHFGCGGGLKDGCAANGFVGKTNGLACAGICLGMLGCIWRLFAGTHEVSITQSGISIQWGEPAIATAIILAELTLMTTVLEFLAPEQLEETNHTEVEPNHEEDDEAEDGEAAEAELSSPPQLAAPGVSEPMKLITSRAQGMVLGLVAMQMRAAQPSSDGIVGRVLAYFSGPFRAGFSICAAAMVAQVCLLIAFTAYHCDLMPVPEPPLDGTGTLHWQPSSETGRKVLGNLRILVLLTLQGGLVFGILGLGLLPWSLVGVVAALVVFPCLPTQGKTNIFEVVSWKIFFLKSCLGAIGTKLEAHMAHRRAIADAAAAVEAEQAADALVGQDSKRKNSIISDDGKKKGTPNASPKKAGAPKPKKKKN